MCDKIDCDICGCTISTNEIFTNEMNETICEECYNIGRIRYSISKIKKYIYILNQFGFNYNKYIKYPQFHYEFEIEIVQDIKDIENLLSQLHSNNLFTPSENLEIVDKQTPQSMCEENEIELEKIDD